MASSKTSELLNVLGDVKARVQDKLGLVQFPMPQFILIGKQSVGKSRLIEALAGEQFNFCSGTLGSRRPTVLEFRNVDGASGGDSRWFVRDRVSNQWGQHPIRKVMELIGSAHEELGAHVSAEPVYCRIESPNCVDMQIVDLPGFREFASDDSKRELAEEIQRLVTAFMEDTNNVMICVEESGDAANMSTLQRCRALDPRFLRTVLVRNKLDKYYGDLTKDNVNQWAAGHGDIPDELPRFCLTLPHWSDGQDPPKPFAQLREENSNEDVRVLNDRNISAKWKETVGFNHFSHFMENKIEQLFVDALGPVMANLKDLKESTDTRSKDLQSEFEETDPQRILSTCRDCGASFGNALNHVMEGVISLSEGRMTLEQELNEFHTYHKSIGSKNFSLLPTEDFESLEDYIDYLRNEYPVGAFDVEINGGAQFRRMMSEAEIFLRFAEISVDMKKKDVIQARGVSMSSLTWRDVVVKLLSNEAHLPLLMRVMYVGERIKWFFCKQKVAVMDFMCNLEGTPAENMFSPLFPKHAKLLTQNESIKHLVFSTYDGAVDRQLKQFGELFESLLVSTFSNPWVFLKGATVGEMEGEALEDAVLPSFEDTKERIPQEIESRSGIEVILNKWLASVPSEPERIDEAVDKVQMLVLRTYSFIRSQVCDQVELFAESFFKLPMMRRLEEDMSKIVLDEEEQKNYEARRGSLEQQNDIEKAALVEVNWCIDRLKMFTLGVQACK